MGKTKKQRAKAEAKRQDTLRSTARRGRVTLAPGPWDMGADGPANRERLREEPATDIDPETGRETPNPNSVKRMRRESWVDIYEKAGRLNRSQVAAAEKLRNAADGLRDRDPLAALGEVRSVGCGDIQEARVDARRFFHQLWAAVPKASRPVLERVVIDDTPIWHGNLEQRERHMQRLREGLDAIC